jgi:hypothetical protein
MEHLEYIFQLIVILILIVIALVLLGEALRVIFSSRSQSPHNRTQAPTRIASGNEQYTVDFDSDPEVYPITPANQHIATPADIQASRESHRRWQADRWVDDVIDRQELR